MVDLFSLKMRLVPFQELDKSLQQALLVSFPLSRGSQCMENRENVGSRWEMDILSRLIASEMTLQPQNDIQRYGIVGRSVVATPLSISAFLKSAEDKRCHKVAAEFCHRVNQIRKQKGVRSMSHSRARAIVRHLADSKGLQIES